MNSFTLSRMPTVSFGAGKFAELGRHAARFGSTVLVLTGGSSLETSGKKSLLLDMLGNVRLDVTVETIAEEPSPEIVDAIVSSCYSQEISSVIAVGGGSVIDTGKAVSAMLPSGEPVVPYLEGVGGKAHDGRKIPFIAVPTTAGTGSEATKNAVLSHVGRDGFKKSLRHDNFVPDIALIDPELMLNCPPQITAATGLDAFSQLLESYVSTQANQLTDSLALSGLENAAANLIPACTSGSHDIIVRSGMAYAAYCSGITLANAGLGVVHGFASSVGGMFPIPHGVVCGALLPASIAVTIERLRGNYHENLPYLKKFARVSGIVTGRRHRPVDEACDGLISTLEKWRDMLKIPRLGEYGIGVGDIDAIVKATGNKNNPVKLGNSDLRRILEESL